MQQNKKHIAIIAGGYSSEYSISMESALEVIRALDPGKYKATIVHISKTDWQAQTESGSYPIDKNAFTYQINGSAEHFDAVFNAIHGTPGEDGILQAYFELINLPFTGCDSFSSSLTFNKFACNNLLRAFGIRVAQSVLLRKGDSIDQEKILNLTNLPCFVKPNNGGSSCGISRVNKAAQLIPAIESALKEDDEVIIEAYLQGTELTCGLVKSKGQFLAFPITEIVSKKEFFDYEAKYTPGIADEITPARVPDLVRDQCQDISKEIYSILNCRGLVRMDYILVKDQLWFLEVNTVPGMTQKSLVPQQIRAAGMTESEIYSLILEDILKD